MFDICFQNVLWNYCAQSQIFYFPLSRMLIFFPSVWFKYRVACEFNILCRAVLMILPTCCIERYLCNSLVDLWVKLIYNIVVLSECSTITGVLGYVCVCGGVFDMLPGQEFVDFITAESNDLYMYMWLVQIHFLHFHSCNNFEGLVFTKPSICTMLITCNLSNSMIVLYPRKQSEKSLHTI